MSASGLFDEVTMGDSSAPPAGGGAYVTRARPSSGLFDNVQGANPSTTTDVAKGSGIGLAKGANAIAGLPHDISQLLDYIPAWLIAKGAEKLGFLPEGKTAEDLIKAGEEANFKPSPLEPSWPGGAELQKGEETITGPFYQPKTTPGKYAQAIATMVPAVAAGPGSIAMKAGQAVFGGAGGEALGSLPAVEGTAWETPLRIAGTIAGSGVPSVAKAAKTSLTRPYALRQAVEGATVSDIDKAHELITFAKETHGIDLPWTQALQEVTGGGTNFTNVERFIANSTGGAALRKVMADRPGQIEAAGNRVLRTSAPGAMQTPVEAGLTTQQAAKGLLLKDEATRTASTRDLYAKANPVELPQPDMEKLLADMDSIIARDKTGVVTSEVKRLRDMISEEEKPLLLPRGEIPFEMPAATAKKPAPLPTAGTGAKPQAQTLVGFLQRLGGVKDVGGDLKASGLDRFPGLVRPNGVSLDKAREAAAEAGFLGPNIDEAMASTTPRNLIDKLNEHPAYSVHDQEAMNAFNIGKARSAKTAQDLERARGDITNELLQGGMKAKEIDPAALDRAALLHVNKGESIGTAYERAVMMADEPVAKGAAGFPGDRTAPSAPKRIPVLDIENLNNARIVTRDRLGMPQIGADAITKKQAGAVAPFLERLRFMMERASPDFKAANKKHIEVTNATVKPQQAGPLGKIAKTEEISKHAAALFPTGKAVGPGQEGVLGEAVKRLASRDPRAAEAVVDWHLQSLFATATERLQGQPNPMGGANFAKALMGNVQEAKNVRAVVEALPNGRERMKGIEKFVDVLRATGRAANVGSPTAPMQEIQREARKGVIGAVVSGATVTKVPQALREFAMKFEMGLNTKRMAKIITNPKSVGLFRDLAKADPASSKAGALAWMLIMRSEGAASATNQKNKRE